MRFGTGHAAVTVNGFGEQASFKIAASGKAFKGLIDGLYSRKIEAMIRELSTNAYDAAKAAGTNQPFDVHLPTLLEPWFSIRDYGTGMTHDLVMHRYTTMFDSTKDGLNEEDGDVNPDEQVGMLGLGSKSFFAYTDTCTLSVWLDGEARHYSVFMGESGIPQIALAGRHESSEPTGVKVQVAASADDCNAFKSAAVRVFKGFDITPNGLAPDVVEAISHQPDITGSFWRLYPKEFLTSHRVWAKQGCVLYPIELIEVDPSRATTKKSLWRAGEYITTDVPTLSPNYHRLNEMAATLIIDFPIGSVEFDLGRERLAYTLRTITAVRNRLAELFDDMLAEPAATITPDMSAWQRAGIVYEYIHRTPAGSIMESSEMATAARKVVNEVFGRFPATKADRDGEHFPIHSIIMLGADGEVYGAKVGYTLKNLGIAEKEHERPMPQGIGKSIFVYMDDPTTRSLNMRTKHYLAANGLKYAFVMSPEYNLTADRYKSYGCPPVIRASELPLLPKKQKAARTYHGGGGKFDRVKLIECGSLVNATSAADYENHLFALMNCGEVYNADATYRCKTTRVMQYSTVTEFVYDRPISFLNLRSPDFKKLDKWSDFEMYDDHLANVGENMSRAQIRMAVDYLNYRKFSDSHYDSKVEMWSAIYPGSRDSISNLKRFKARFDRIPARCHTALGHLTETTYHYGGPNFLAGMADKIRIRALEYEFEVLPEHKSGFPYPLLHRRDERMLQHMSKMYTGSEEQRKYARITLDALKEHYACHS